MSQVLKLGSDSRLPTNRAFHEQPAIGVAALIIAAQSCFYCLYEFSRQFFSIDWNVVAEVVAAADRY